MPYRQFHISDVLTVATGRLVSSRHIEGVYDIPNFMTGDNLYTHSLPRAAAECRPYLMQSYPFLAEVDINKLDALLKNAKASSESVEPADVCAVWIKEEMERLNIPEMLDVYTIPTDAHNIRNPIAELIEMMHKK